MSDTENKAGESGEAPKKRRSSRSGPRKPWSPEQKAKHSEAMKKAWADPEIRERISSGIRQALTRPETREAMKAGHQRRREKKAALKAALVSQTQETPSAEKAEPTPPVSKIEEDGLPPLR